jgi:DNA-binding LytR/AlgR family response regulator
MSSTVVIPSSYYAYLHTLPFLWQDVQRLEGDRNYTTFHLTNGERHLLSKSICIYEPHIPNQFFRVHKSCVVNLQFVINLNKNDKCILLSDGTKVQVARRRLRNVLTIITNYLSDKSNQLQSTY